MWRDTGTVQAVLAAIWRAMLCYIFGWFHKTVFPSTLDTIEVRSCADQQRSNEDVLTDLVEIWLNHVAKRKRQIPHSVSSSLITRLQ